MTLAARIEYLLVALLVAVSPAPGADLPRSPLPAEDTLPLFQLHPDCRIELVAAEPDVIDPVHIAFDPDGRLWVVEYSDYPNGPTAGEPGQSRIRVLTDDDGDGRFTNPRVFVDKLLFANGLTFWKDGVIVTTDGAVVFMRDTDGDGRADDKQVWFTGFKRENPQLRANHPTFTLDNHFHIANGLRGGDVIAGPDWAKAFPQPSSPGPGPSTLDPQPVSLSGRDFRFDPRTGAYEAVAGMGQFGVTFDDWGNRFICSNRNPCDHVVLEEVYLQRNPSVAVSKVIENVSPDGEESRIFPVSRFWTTSNLHAGQFTAACGVCLYRGDALPASFYGNSFTCDPTGNLVHRDVLEPSGATFRSHYGRDGVEFLATTDEWCRPVNLTVGPDGALYVVDMYRAVIEHPQYMPDELKNRPDLLLGTDRGRIYRIVARDAPAGLKRPWPKLAAATAAELVELLSHPNAWQRETAQRLLFERQDASLADQLSITLHTTDRPQARVHAFSLLAGIGELSGELLQTELKRERDPHVVEHLIRLAGTSFGEKMPVAVQSHIETLARTTDNTRLRFQSLLTLTLCGEGAVPVDVLADTAVKYGDDQWMRAAVLLATSHPQEVLTSLLRRLPQYQSTPASETPLEPALLDLIRQFAALTAASADADGIRTLLGDARDRVTSAQFALLEGLGEGLRRRGQRIDNVLPDFAESAAGLFALADVRVRHRTTYPETSSRIEGARALEFAPTKYTATLLDSGLRDPEQAVRMAVIDVLSRRPEEAIGPALVDVLNHETPAVRHAALSALLASSARTRLLLGEIAAGHVSPREIDPTRANQLRNHRDVEIRELAAKLLKDDTDADRVKVLAAYNSVLSSKSDPKRGREVFAKNCVQCHKVGDLGVNVPPDISDSRVKTAEQLLVSILDPNRAIDNNYFSYTVVDKEGVVHTGVIATETATSVTLKQPEGKEVTLLRSDIDELKSNGVSLMPVGLEKNITVEQMADLISFIKNWRYLDGSVPPEVIR